MFSLSKHPCRILNGLEVRQVELEEFSLFSGDDFEFLDNLRGFGLVPCCNINHCVMLQKRLLRI
jgi:hypothetical protein